MIHSLSKIDNLSPAGISSATPQTEAKTLQGATISIIRDYTDKRLQKSVFIGLNGLESISAPSPYKGKVTAIEVPTAAGLAALITALKPIDCLVLGSTSTPVGTSIDLRTRKGLQFADTDRVVARTKDFFSFPNDREFWLLFDVDPEPGVPRRSQAEIWEILCEMYPAIASCAHVWVHSSSSFIYGADGEELKGEGNYHLYVRVCGDVDAFADHFKRSAWLHRYGFYKLSKINQQTGAASILERHSFDTTVFSPERIIYESGVNLGAGLVQKRPSPKAIEGNTFDLSDLPVLTDAQIAIADQLKAEAKAAIVATRLSKTTDHIIKHEKVSRDRAKVIATARLEKADRDELPHDLVIYLENGQTVTAGALTKAHHGIRCLDPFEPDYRPGDYSIATIFYNRDYLRIVSHAHGRKVYRLEFAETPANNVVSVNPTKKAPQPPTDKPKSAAVLLREGNAVARAEEKAAAREAKIEHIQNHIAGLVGGLGFSPIGDALKVNTRDLANSEIVEVLKSGNYNLIINNSATGTGKTELIARLVKGLSVLGINHRVMLGLSLAVALDCKFRNHLGKRKRVGEELLYVDRDDNDRVVERMISVTPGLRYINIPFQFGYLNVLVLDEFSAWVQDLLTSSIIEDREEIIAQVAEACRMADCVMAAGADMSQLDIEMLKLLMGDKYDPAKTATICNEYRPEGGEIELIKMKGKASATKAIAYMVPHRKNFNFWAVDSKRTARKLRARIKRKGGKVLMLMSDTAKRLQGDLQYQMMLQNVYNRDLWAVRRAGYTDVIISPSIVEGWSVTDGAFDAHFAIFTGLTTSPIDMRQQIRRDRQARKFMVYVAGGDTNLVIDPAALKRDYYQGQGFAKGERTTRGQEERERLTLSPALRASLIDITTRYKAIENAWKHYPEPALRALLEQYNYTVKENWINVSDEEEKSAWDETQAEERQLIIEAPIIDEATYQQLRKREREAECWRNRVDDDGNDFIDRLIQREFERETGERTTPTHEDEESPVYPLDADEYDSMRRYELVTMYGLFPHRLDHETIITDDDRRYRARVRRFERAFDASLREVEVQRAINAIDALPGDVPIGARQDAFLAKVGAWEYIVWLWTTLDFGAHKEAPQTRRLAAKLIEHSEECYQLFGLRPDDSQSVCRMTNMFLSRAWGLVFRKHRPVIDGKQAHVYRIDETKGDELLAIIQRRMVNRENRDRELAGLPPRSGKLLRGAALVRKMFDLPDFEYCPEQTPYAEALNSGNISTEHFTTTLKIGDQFFPIGWVDEAEDDEIEITITFEREPDY